MDVVIPFLIGPAFFLALFGFAAWMLYFGPKRDGKRWARAAEALGLTLEPRTAAHRVSLFQSGPTIKQMMYGQRGGVPVQAGVRIVVRNSGKSRSVEYFTYAEALFPRSLEIGLDVVPSSWLAGAFERLLGQEDLEIGIPALDSAYRVQASIADQARALLTAPSVAEPLVALSRVRFRPQLSDDHVRLEAHGKVLDARDLQRPLDDAVELARRIVSARMTLGPSALQRTLAATWRPVAEQRGLTLDLERYVIHGRCEGLYVEVRAHQDGARYGTSFGVCFDRPLGLGLKLERQGALSPLGALLGMQDIRTGDETFDDRFVVKGAPVEGVRALLTPEVRRMLLLLQEQTTTLEVEDRWLRAHVSWLVSEPAWLHAGIDSVARAGVALRGGGAAAVGPYRS